MFFARKIFKLTFYSVVLAVAFFAYSSVASADSHTWTGLGADGTCGGGVGDGNKWSCAANWTGSAVPAGTDTIVFDATSTKNSTIDSSYGGTNAGLTISSGYTGTITQQRSLTINGSYSQSDGVFTGASQDIYIQSSFTLAGGTFTSTTGVLTVRTSWTHTAGGTFDPNGGTVKAGGNSTAVAWNFNSSETFYNFIMDCNLDSACGNSTWGITLQASDNLIVNNTFTYTDGLVRFNTTDGGITAKGDVVVSSGYIGSNTSSASLLTLGGTSSQNLNLTGATDAYNNRITINNAAGVVLLSDLVLDASGQDLTLTSGALNIGSYNLTVDDDLAYSASGTIANSGSNTITVGDWSQSGGTFNGQNSTINFTTFTLSGGTFSASTGTMTVSSTWTHTAGGTFTHNSGTVKSTINASLASSWNFNSSETFGNFIVNCNGDSDCGDTSYGPYLASGDNLIVSGNLTLTDGTLSYSSADGGVTVSGNVTVGSGWDGAGTPSSLVFSGSSSQNFDLTGATSNFNGGVTINNAAGVVLLSDLILDASGKDLTLSNGVLNIGSYSLTVADDLTYNGGTITNSGSNTITVNDWSQSSGIFGGSNSTVVVNATFTLSGGTFGASTGTMTVGTTWTHTAGGTFTHNSGTVKAIIDTSTASSWNFNSSETFGNFIVDCNGDSACSGANYGPYLASGDNLIVSGNLTLTDGTINYSTSDGGITVQGNVTVGTGWDGGGTSWPKITFAGSTTQAFDLTGATGTVNNDITINGASTVVNLASALLMDAGSQDLTITTGTLDLSGTGVTVSGAGGTFVVGGSGNLQLQGGETVSGTPTLNSGSTVTYDGTGTTYAMQDWTMTNSTLIINGGASSVFTLGATETVNNLTITSGILSLGGNGLTVSTTFSNDGTLRLRGNETVSLTMDTNSGTIEYTGDGDAGADTYTVTSISTNYYNLTINSTDGATDIFQLGATLGVNGSLTITSGILSLGGNGLTVSTTFSNDGTLRRRGNEAVTLTMDTNSGTVEVTGDGDAGADTYTVTSISANYYNLTISSTDGATDIFQLGTALDVNGSLTITAGTFNVTNGNYGITVGRNFSNSGTFNASSGTVTFDDSSGTGTIAGSASFYNLSCVTAGKALLFTAGTTQTVTGTFTMTGSGSGTSMVVLRSTSGSSQWNLNISGSSSISYVDVKDSNASGGNAINAKGTNSTNSGNNLNWTFNTAPSVSSVTASQVTDGSGYVTVSFILDDDDDNTNKAKVEYNVGAGWLTATLVTTSGTSSTYGSFFVDNTQTYQIGTGSGYIWTSPGANTISVKWNSQTDVPTANLSTAQIRITPYDGYDVGSSSSSSNFTMDNVVPAGLAGFTSGSTTSSTIVWTWTAGSDTNFNHYEIWYGTNQTDVNNRSGTASEWDNSDDATLATATTATTTITGLSENTTYYAKIWIIDSYGNSATLSAASANNNGKPTIGAISVSQSGSGNQYVTIQFSADDADDDNTLRALIQYNVGSGWNKATINTTSGTSSTYGSFFVDNNGTYQIGSGSGYIVTSSGANTISVIWRSDTDVPSTDTNSAQIKITLYDGIETGAAVTSDSFVVDGVSPTTPGSFTKSSGSGTSAVFTWTATTESHFNHYEIWYGTNQTDVNNRNGTASEWDNDPNDATLATKTTATTTTTGLTPGSTYYAKICAVDNYGYEACSSSTSFTTNQSPTVSTVTATQATDATSNVTITFIMDDADDDNTLQALVEYNVGSGWTKATLASSGTSSTYGSFNLNNSNSYQVGNSNGYITSSSGANTITVIWSSATDVTAQDTTSAQIRVTPYDTVASGSTSTSSNFTLDQVAPSGGLTSVTGSNIVETSFTLGWNSVTSESNFDKYEIYYKLSSAGSYSLYGSSTTMSTGSADISGLVKGTSYDFYVKALDAKGNSLTSSTVNVTTKNYDNPSYGEIVGGGASSGGGYSGGGSNDETEGSGSLEEDIEDDMGQEDTESTEDTASEEISVTIEIISGETVEETEESFEETWNTEVVPQLDEHWSEPYLKDFYQTTLINQISSGGTTEAQVISYLFDPEEKVTRMEFLVSAMDLMGIEVDTQMESMPFVDMTVADNRAAYVVTAYDMGVIVGYDDGTFRPENLINRAEALKVMFKLAGDQVEERYGDELLDYYYLPSNPFPDLDLDAWYAPYVMYAYARGIVSGYGDGYFRPERDISRGEMAKIITILIAQEEYEDDFYAQDI